MFVFKVNCSALLILLSVCLSESVSNRVSAKVDMFERKGMQLSKIHPVSEPLRLGRLAGNRFDLIIRDLRPHERSSAELESLVKEAVENVKVNQMIIP